MNYRKLFKKVILLLSSPAKAWEEISFEQDKRKGLITFVYPMIGLCGLAVFAGAFINSFANDDINLHLIFQTGMTRCCAVFVAYFAGFYLAAKTICGMCKRWFHVPCDTYLAEQFTGYAMVVPLVLKFIVEIVPAFHIFKLIFQFYTIFVVWEGARVLLKIGEKQRTTFSILSSLLIILCPFIIELIFNKLTFLLN